MADELTKMNGFAEDFEKAVTPKVLEGPEEMFLFQCTECGGVHFRHAGYIETLLPYVRADKQAKVDSGSYQVKVCVKCRRCFVWYNEQMYDVTDLIDLDAWEKAEKDLHKATGPGGEC